MTRCFIAFPVSAEIKNIIFGIQEKIKKSNPAPPVKWAQPESIHVTVEFLGDLTGEQIEEVKEILKDAAPVHPAFDYELSFLDAFPDVFHPKVLVLKLKDEKLAGHSLYGAIHRRLQKNNLASNNRPWRPHLTLGRAKARWKPDDNWQKIEVPRRFWRVERIILFKSELAPRGPIYTPLAEYKLRDEL